MTVLSLPRPSATLKSTTGAAVTSLTLHHLVLSHAAAHSFTHVLLGTTLTRASIRVLSGVAEGKAYAAGEEVASEWEMQTGVRLVKPLVGCLQSEVGFWAEQHGWKAVERRQET